MGKIVGAVVAGYVTMFVVVFILFAVGWMMLGADGSFRADSWDVSFAWVLLSLAIGLVAAIAGGYLCQAIAKDPRGILGLLAVVIVLGLAMAVIAAVAPETPVRTRPDSLSMFDAMSGAQQPVWLAFVNPFLGAVGVLIGARMRGSATV